MAVEDRGAGSRPTFPWIGQIEGARAVEQHDLRGLIENTSALVTMLDLEGTILFINRALPGLKRDQIIGSSVYDHVPGEFHEKIRQVIRTCIETGRPANYDSRGPSSGGTTSWCRNDLAPLTQDGRVVALVLTSSDVAERKTAVEALKASEERFRLIVENSSEAFLLCDEEARCYYANHVYEQIWGRSLGSLYADPGALRDAIHPEDRDRVLCSCRRLETGAPFDEQYRVVRPDGTVRWVWDRTQRIPDEHGRGARTVSVIRDITDRKLMYAQLSSQRKLLDAFFSAAPAGMAILDGNLSYVRINETLAKTNGSSVDDHLGRSIGEVIPGLAPSVEPIMEAVRNTGKPALNMEVSGEVGSPAVLRHFISSYFPVALGDGEESPGVGAVVVDVTEMRNATEEMRARARQQAAVAELGQRALTAIDLHTLMDEAVALAARTLEVECCDVLELLPSGDKLMVRATVGPGQVEGGMLAVKAHSLPGYTLARAEPVVVEDVAADNRFRHCVLFSLRGAVSGLTAIIQSQFKPYGILGAYASRRRKFSQDDVSFLQAVANVIAHAAERRHAEEEFQQLSGRLLRLQDEERRRIARDLHDSTSQNLAALAINLGVLGEHVEPETPAGKSLRQSVELVEACTREIRTFSYLLHPPMLDELGLAAAFRWYVRGFAERSGIKADLNLPAELGRLPSEVELTLYRILQEGLANVHRHSGSPTVEISLVQKPRQVVLSITDQGHGMPSPALASKGREHPREENQLGVGILGMRQRVRQFGGTLRVVSGAQGTKVTATLPVDEPLGRVAPDTTDAAYHRAESYGALLIEAAKQKHVLIREQLATEIERLRTQIELMQMTLKDRHPDGKR